jgi:tetratricopeptide (TPR) repeat protein
VSAQRARTPVPITPSDPQTLTPAGQSIVSGLENLVEAAPSEEDRDRALALFAEGRLLFQREDYPAAMQRYQRSYQWNPEVGAAVAEVVPLAFHLQDVHTGSRYAVLSAEHAPTQTDLVDPVIGYLSEQQEFARAYRLKARALAVTEVNKQSSEWVEHHHDLGRLAFLASLFPEASESFAVVADALERPEAFQLDRATQRELERNGEILFGLMGEAFLRASRIDLAEKMFTRAQNVATNDDLFVYRQAQIAHARGEDAKALELLQKYLDANATVASIDAYDLLHDVLKALNQLDDADHGYVATLVRAGQRLEPNPALSFALADAYRKRERYEQALPLFQVALDETPTQESYEGALICSYKLKDVPTFFEVLGDFVDNGGDWEVLGEDGQTIAKDRPFIESVFAYVESEKSTDTATSRKVKQAAAIFGVGLIAVQAEDISKAEQYFSDAISLPSSDEMEWVLSAALEFYVAGEYPSAITWLRRAYEKAEVGRAEPIAIYLATALEYNGQTDEALQVIADAIPRANLPIGLRARRVWINYHAKRYADSKSESLELLKDYDHIRDDMEVREALKDVRSNLSNLSLLDNDTATAAEWLEQILDEFPEDAGTMNDLGYLWADAKLHLNRSLRMVRYAVKEYPDNYAYLDSLGWTLFRLDRCEEAIPLLERAAELSEGDGVVLDHLGEVYAKVGRHTDAINAWQRAKESFKKADEHDKMKAIEAKISASPRS